MKKTLLALLFAGVLLAMPGRAAAHEYDRDDSDHPLRLVGYLLHPIGIAIEYTVLRPVHYLVSRPNNDKIFGHEPHEEPGHDYMAWE